MPCIALYSSLKVPVVNCSTRSDAFIRVALPLLVTIRSVASNVGARHAGWLRQLQRGSLERLLCGVDRRRTWSLASRLWAGHPPDVRTSHRRRSPPSLLAQQLSSSSRLTSKIETQASDRNSSFDPKRTSPR